MPNMSLTKLPMPEQAANVRNKNFEEVALGYTPEMAIEEAKRCLQCKNKPCESGCPVSVQIKDFISAVADGDFESGYRIVKQTNSLPAVCGRVCPQETQCEMLCVRGKKGEPVGIGRIERFVADYHMQRVDEKLEQIRRNGHKVAVVGSGPAGLSCAGELASRGYAVTIFEAFHTPGGVLVYGIPEFRLPKAIVASEVEGLRQIGVEIRTNMVIGKVLSIDELFDMGYEAVFIGSGAGLPMFMNIPGENLIGVYSANEYLTRINMMRAYDDAYDTPLRRHKKVAVIGGGNVAMDAARSAKRLGAKDVYIVYRRSMTELPARAEEVHHAEEEGIEFRLLTNPVAILGNDDRHVRAVECIKMELGEVDASGRRRPVPAEGSNHEIEVDAVIMSIGTSPNPLIRLTTDGLDVNKWGCLVADEKMATTRKGVYAGGDAVTGAATVILAMGAGRTAADSIDNFIRP